jgi:hypothetical protein
MQKKIISYIFTRKILVNFVSRIYRVSQIVYLGIVEGVTTKEFVIVRKVNKENRKKIQRVHRDRRKRID